MSIAALDSALVRGNVGMAAAAPAVARMPLPTASPASALSLPARAIAKLDLWDQVLDEKLPHNVVQKVADQFGDALQKTAALMEAYLKRTFAPLVRFSEFLDKCGEGDWYQRLAAFLVKLPFRAVRNVVRTLYSIIENLVYVTVHPLKALNRVAKLLVRLVDELSDPDTLVKISTKVGAGMIGVGLGQAAMGNPLSVIGLGVGVGILLGGLVNRALLSAIDAQPDQRWQKIKDDLWELVKEVPEATLTGFCMGLLIGGIQQAIVKHQKKVYAEFETQQKQRIADQFVKENNLPPYTKAELVNGKISMEWRGNDLEAFKSSHGGFLKNPWDPHEARLTHTITVDLHQSGSNLHQYVPNHGWGSDPWDVDVSPYYDYQRDYSLAEVGLRAVPVPAVTIPGPNPVLVNCGPIIAGPVASRE